MVILTLLGCASEGTERTRNPRTGIANVLQEILHRYVAIQRRDAALDTLLGVVDEVFPVEREDVERAKLILDGHPDLSARDAIHLSVMRRREVGRVMSFDAGFDGVPGMGRIC